MENILKVGLEGPNLGHLEDITGIPVGCSVRLVVEHPRDALDLPQWRFTIGCKADGHSTLIDTPSNVHDRVVDHLLEWGTCDLTIHSFRPLSEVT